MLGTHMLDSHADGNNVPRHGMHLRPVLALFTLHIPQMGNQNSHHVRTVFRAALLVLFSIATAYLLAPSWIKQEAIEHFQEELSHWYPHFNHETRGNIHLAARLQEKDLKLGAPVFIRIFKETSELEVWLENDEGQFQLLDSFPICKWSGTLGPKLKEGDHQSPEGFYLVSRKQLYPMSRHHRAFNIGFPNAYDRAHQRTGTYLMVHGGCTSEGCYAITDSQVQEIYKLVDSALDGGQETVPVHIFPFRMTHRRLEQEKQNPWYDFWSNLKVGYDLFEITQTVPVVSQCGGVYQFNQKPSAQCQHIASW